MLAFGKDVALGKINKSVASFFESLGAMIFVTLAIIGLGYGYFFFNFLPKGEPFRLFSSGLIPLYNIAITFKVGAGLFIMFVVLVTFRLAKKGGEE